MGFDTRKQLSLLPSQRTITQRIVIGDVSLSGDPTAGEVSADSTNNDDLNYKVLHAIDVEIDASKIISVNITLNWTSQMSSGTGSTKWMVGNPGQTPGALPVSATDISDVIVAPGTKTSHDLSGLVKESVFTSGTWSLILVGKPDTASETVTATIKNTSQLEITYTP